MKTYKKPISLLIDIDIEDLMNVSAEVFQKPTETGSTDSEEHIGYGGTISTGSGDAKGFESWE